MSVPALFYQLREIGGSGRGRVSSSVSFLLLSVLLLGRQKVMGNPECQIVTVTGKEGKSSNKDTCSGDNCPTVDRISSH